MNVNFTNNTRVPDRLLRKAFKWVVGCQSLPYAYANVTVRPTSGPPFALVRITEAKRESPGEWRTHQKIEVRDYETTYKTRRSITIDLPNELATKTPVYGGTQIFALVCHLAYAIRNRKTEDRNDFGGFARRYMAANYGEPIGKGTWRMDVYRVPEAKLFKARAGKLIPQWCGR